MESVLATSREGSEQPVEESDPLDRELAHMLARIDQSCLPKKKKKKKK